jgi:predicted DNA-binding transcriptional regulator AlpA
MARREYFTGARRLDGQASPSPQAAGTQASSVADVLAPPPAAHSLDQAIARLLDAAGDRAWLDVHGICAYLGIGRTTYYRMLRAGTWPIPEMWPRFTATRFHVDDVIAYLRSAAACHADERLTLVRGRVSHQAQR